MVQSCNVLIAEMVDFFVWGKKNGYSEYMGPEGKKKFHALLHYVIQNGEPPKAPILVSHTDGCEIMDGNHRLVAYLVWTEWQHNEQFLEKLECEPVPIHLTIPFWVGRYE